MTTDFEQRELDNLLKTGYRLTPATMAHHISGGMWIAARHLLYISTIIATELEKGGARIIVTMPPRHGKSRFLSVGTPIWFLDRWPEQYVILTSYGADLATDFGREVRDTILESTADLSVRLRPDSLQVARFLTTKGGGMFAVGLGGTVTGRGGNLFLIDDYVKNAADSMSDTIRQRDWDWFRAVAYTRLEPNASIIILATRWNIRDLIGMVLEETADKWLVIRLPALAEANDPLGRAEGEPLWPDRYSLENLMTIKETLGTYWWSAMYQQRPLPSMAGMSLGSYLEVVKPEDLPHPMRLKKVRSWDFAASQATGDFTAGPLQALDKETGDYYILDMQHFQKSPKGTELMVKTVAVGDGPGIPIWIEQEPGSSGKIVIEYYQKDVLPGFAVKGQKPTGPLEVRASPFFASVEARKYKILRAPWNAKLIEEIDYFGPDAEHDDQVAALALGHERLTRGRFGSVIWGEKNVSPHLYTPKSHKIVTGVTW